MSPPKKLFKGLTVVVRNFILLVHDFIVVVRNFIVRVHNFILHEQLATQPTSFLGSPTLNKLNYRFIPNRQMSNWCKTLY